MLLDAGRDSAALGQKAESQKSKSPEKISALLRLKTKHFRSSPGKALKCFTFSFFFKYKEVIFNVFLETLSLRESFRCAYKYFFHIFINI